MGSLRATTVHVGWVLAAEGAGDGVAGADGEGEGGEEAGLLRLVSDVVTAGAQEVEREECGINRLGLTA